jgi:ammonium transporter, Amt family
VSLDNCPDRAGRIHDSFVPQFSDFGFINVLDAPSPASARIPEILFAIYQAMFAGVTAVIAFGATAERGRIGPQLILVFAWLTLVYSYVANPPLWLPPPVC